MYRPVQRTVNNKQLGEFEVLVIFFIFHVV